MWVDVWLLCVRTKSYRRKTWLQLFSVLLSVYEPVPAVDVEATSSSSHSSQSLTCWNCQQAGHSYQRCSLPRKRFCYRCGRADVTVRNGSTCNQSGNANRSP